MKTWKIIGITGMMLAVLCWSGAAQANRNLYLKNLKNQAALANAGQQPYYGQQPYGGQQPNCGPQPYYGSQPVYGTQPYNGQHHKPRWLAERERERAWQERERRLEWERHHNRMARSYNR